MGPHEQVYVTVFGTVLITFRREFRRGSGAPGDTMYWSSVFRRAFKRVLGVCLGVFLGLFSGGVLGGVIRRVFRRCSRGCF